MARFVVIRPTRSGRVGHPGNGNKLSGRKMFKCAGLIFDDFARSCRWTYRYYFATDEWPVILVWARANMIRRNNKSVAFEVSRVIPDEADVPEDVYQFGRTELVRLRLRGEIGA